MKIMTTDGYEVEDSPVVIQRCGDRGGNGNLTVHDYSNCIPANPMSDRGQLVFIPLEIEDEDNADW